MDFNCPGCNKSGNIDDTKMTKSGVYATCPQCKNKFLIKPEASKDFVYETVVQSEPQQASLKPPAATTQSGGDSSIPADTTDSQKPLKISANAETSRISTKPLEFFFSFLFLSSVRLASDLSVHFGLQLGAIFVGLLALCGILLGWLVGKFIGEKLNVSRLQRTHKIFSAWAICIASFVILIAFFTVTGGPQQKIPAPNSNPPVQTTSQPEYSQPQTTGTLPTEPKAASQPEDSHGFRIDDAVVTDIRTGLMWTRDANIFGKLLNWYVAEEQVKRLSIGGYNDWRLPTADELMTMKNYFGYGPSDSLNRIGFINVQKDSLYMSSTIGPQGVVAVYMRFGYSEEAAEVAKDKTALVVSAWSSDKSATNSVWPVRDGR